MQKLLTICLFSSVALLMACSAEPDNKIKLTSETTESTALIYPDVDVSDQVDEYFTTKVADPYRWLEFSGSQQANNWLKLQTEITEHYLTQISYRESIQSQLKKLLDYEHFSVPVSHGDYLYFQVYANEQGQTKLYRSKNNQRIEAFLTKGDLLGLDEQSILSARFSRNGNYLALTKATANSAKRQIITMDAISKRQIDVAINNVDFTDIAWLENKGYFYSKSKANGKYQILYFHTLGTESGEDRAVFGFEAQKFKYLSADVTSDDKFLVIQAANSTSGNRLYLLDLSSSVATPVTVLNDSSSDTFVINKDEDFFYLMTNRGAPNHRVVRMPVNNPSENAWQEIIPEAEQALSVSVAGGYLYAKYIIDALSKVIQYDFNGKQLRTIELPGEGSISSFQQGQNDKYAYYSFSNYHTPPTIYKLNIKTGDSQLFYKPEIAFDADNYTSKQVFYTAKDGTLIPMTITYHKKLHLDGSHPTILYGYGGFDISLLPTFRTEIALWLKMGGIYAVPNIRGGGEYGNSWHLAGTKLQKQTVFDDFIAAAEYLIANNYTTSDFLAINGSSNGGLLVAAVMTQRPDLMRVALPVAGLMDMLRYHNFAAGATWAYEYGTAQESLEMFQYLRGYSPIHNIKAQTEYPATLVTTDKRDDRVLPAHSYKFVAELQAKQTSKSPILLYLENHGQSPESDHYNKLNRYIELYSFTLFNMGVKELPTEL